MTVGVLPITVQNAFRSLFYGVGAGIDIELGLMFASVINKVTGEKRQPPIIVQILPRAMTAVDIFISISVMYVLEARKFLMLGGVIFVGMQSMAILILGVYTYRIICTLRKRKCPLAGSRIQQQEGRLVKNLAFWVVMSLVAAGISTIAAGSMGLGKAYYTSATVHYFINALFVFSRALNAYAQTSYCFPIRGKVRVSFALRAGTKAVAPERAKVLSTTLSCSDNAENAEG